MAKFVLSVPMRVVERHEASGRLLKRTQYKPGDVVELDEYEAERLKEVITPEADYEPESPEDSPESAVGPGARSGQTTAEDSPESPVGSENEDDGQADDTEEADDDLDSLDYPSLQDEAGQRGIAKNQSGDALKAAIREHDAK